MTPSKHELKKCERCRATFECKVGSIELCQCQDITLNDKESEYIRSLYSDCLCVDCLRALQKEYNTFGFYKRIKKLLTGLK